MQLMRWLVVLFSFSLSTVAAYQNTLDSSAEATSKTSAPVEPGQAVYRKYCSVCHAQGIAGAPKTGLQISWQKQVDQGWATLMKHAVAGYKGMPAKGYCMKCSEHDIEEAVEYMLKGTGLDERHP